MPLLERKLIAALRARQARAKRVSLGIGDDAAILRLGRKDELLVTTDFSLEGIHFRTDWQSPECIGHRCLARGLSDIAAMGGHPMAAFLSLAVPSTCPQRWINGFVDGLLKLARRYDVELAGGDTAQSPTGVLADIIVVGSVVRDTAMLRSGAKPGDRIYVTGALGESAATLDLLSRSKIRRRDVFPQPRIEVGEWLRRRRLASAAIDISDGLSTDLDHICEESKVGAVIRAESIPIHPAAQKLARAKSPQRAAESLDLHLALHGGDDYELLFTAPARARMPEQIKGVKITQIGKIVRGRRVEIECSGKRMTLKPQGWEHFRG
jgi:thiamine-monophosphate kinase